VREKVKRSGMRERMQKGTQKKGIEKERCFKGERPGNYRSFVAVAE
jgi:hypothetical protein